MRICSCEVEGCEVEGCGAEPTERVTVYPQRKFPETRALCGPHAAEVRRWAEETEQAKPRSWLQLLPPAPPACSDCKRVVGVEIKALWRRTVCQACYKRAARAKQRMAA